MNKTKVFRRIKVAGLLSLIPIVLAAGPLAGYGAGYYLIKLFDFPRYTLIICAIIGFIAAARETIVIIRAALRSGNVE